MVGGNVLTSQRVTDVVLKAFHAAAASQVRLLGSRCAGGGQSVGPPRLLSARMPSMAGFSFPSRALHK